MPARRNLNNFFSYLLGLFLFPVSHCHSHLREIPAQVARCTGQDLEAVFSISYSGIWGFRRRIKANLAFDVNAHRKFPALFYNVPTQ